MKLTEKERGHIKGRVSKASVIHNVTENSIYNVSKALKLDKSSHRNIDFEAFNSYLKNLVHSV